MLEKGYSFVNMVMNQFAFCIIVCLPITEAHVEFHFEQSGYKEGDSARLIAKYTGGGTEHYVNWYYSQQVSGDNIRDIQNSCQEFLTDAGYPPMTYMCDESTHTYTATITSVPSTAIGKEWGASFTLSNGTTTRIVKDTLQRKTDNGGLSGGAIAGIVIGAVAVLAIIIMAIVLIYKKYA